MDIYLSMKGRIEDLDYHNKASLPSIKNLYVHNQVEIKKMPQKFTKFNCHFGKRVDKDCKFVASQYPTSTFVTLLLNPIGVVLNRNIFPEIIVFFNLESISSIEIDDYRL
jgi:hypothetical protein